ncbi:2'-5'-oligoadenylate synthetase [Mytilus galloprovincialis]|uniref:2'-5'-oligoadenylate synthetase n=1 Tax=Mytilus galloprovincialis TaxID=29158 RepID=A0A8B6G1A6_MYTGA|nr:2'-5'-oligoadenylate synthetase [Mytilus galloprovincialis]
MEFGNRSSDSIESSPHCGQSKHSSGFIVEKQNKTHRMDTRKICSTKNIPKARVTKNRSVKRKQTRRKKKKKQNKSKVNNIIDSKVLPDENYRKKCRAVLKRIGNILKNNVSERYRPAEVIKAGSNGKGTAIKGNSDVDIVFFLPETIFITVESMFSEHELILDDVGKTLKNSNYNVTGRTTKALQLRVKCHQNGSGKSHHIDVDVLPAVNFGISGTKFEKAELKEIYVKMQSGPEEDRKFYTPSLTKQQRHFVKRDRPETLKRLIRFVKYWKNTIIQVKQQDEEPDSFTIENGLRRVMEQLADYKSIEVEFFVFHDESMKQTHTKPYIIDPVNPYSNVLDVTHSDWSAVASHAKKYLKKAYMKTATSRFCS